MTKDFFAKVPIIGVVGCPDLVPSKRKGFMWEFAQELRHYDNNVSCRRVMIPVLRFARRFLGRSESVLKKTETLEKFLPKCKRKWLKTIFPEPKFERIGDVVEYIYDNMIDSTADDIRETGSTATFTSMFIDLRRVEEVSVIREIGGVVIHMRNVPSNGFPYKGKITADEAVDDLYFDCAVDDLKNFVENEVVPRIMRMKQKFSLH